MFSSSNTSHSSDLLVDLFNLATRFSTGDGLFNGRSYRGLVSGVVNSFSEVIRTSDTIDFNSLFNSATDASQVTLSSYASAITAIKSYVSSTIAAQQAFTPSTFGNFFSIPDNAAAFATVGTGGERIDNGRNFSAGQLKWNRSDSSGATLVTYAFDNDFGINGISTDRAKVLFAEALQTWATYAPLNFQEIEDPGSGSQVDILAQSEAIDGPGKTLAFAFFPTVGDITFDTDENWRESSFLETTVHEIGHSLGLDHENDTDAIMNSVLGNRFEGNDAFLFEDDINGIRSLYGAGTGSVRTLAGTPVSTPSPPTQQPAPTNLVTNGSFEDVPLQIGESNTYSSINGWSTISGNGFQADRRPNLVGSAADGTAWVELDALGTNSTIGQNIDTVTGEVYNVSVDFSDGGRPESTTSIRVFWEGNAIDTISGGGRGQWRRFNYELRGGDRSVSTLAFRAIGPADNVGGFIDNVVVTAARESLVAAATEDYGLSLSSQIAHSHGPLSGAHSHGSLSHGCSCHGCHNHGDHDHGDHNHFVASRSLSTPFPSSPESFLT